MTPPISDPRRVLVWRAGALGDTLTLFPALAMLRRLFPGARLEAAGTPAYLKLAQRASLIDQVWDAGHPLFADLFRQRTVAVSGGDTGATPDCDKQHNIEAPGTVAVSTCAGHRAAETNVREWAQALDLAVVWSGSADTIAANLRRLCVREVLTAAPFPPTPTPVSAYLQGCLVPWGGSDETLEMPRLAAGPEEFASTDQVWQQAIAGQGSSVVVLHAGAGSPTKRWPLASFLALATHLRDRGLGVVWSCGPADDDVLRGLEAARERRTAILAGYELQDLCALLARATAVIAADSGVAHLAAALRVPTIVLFGPTDERVWTPRGGRVIVLRAEACQRSPEVGAAGACPARPCCLRDLSVEQVAAALEEV